MWCGCDVPCSGMSLGGMTSSPSCSPSLRSSSESSSESSRYSGSSFFLFSLSSSSPAAAAAGAVVRKPRLAPFGAAAAALRHCLSRQACTDSDDPLVPWLQRGTGSDVVEKGKLAPRGERPATERQPLLHCGAHPRPPGRSSDGVAVDRKDELK